MEYYSTSREPPTRLVSRKCIFEFSKLVFSPLLLVGLNKPILTAVYFKVVYKRSYKIFFEISFHMLCLVLDPRESIDIKISWKFGFLPGHFVSFNLNIRHHKKYLNSKVYSRFLKYILSILLNNMVPELQIKTNEMTRQKSEFSTDFYINRFPWV